MPTFRKTAIAAGVFFIACTAASILSALPTMKLLDANDYLTQLAAHDNRVILGAVIEFVWAITGAGIAVALYPLLSRFSKGFALGAACSRVVEGVFVLVGALGLLALLTLSHESLAGGTAASSSFQASGSLLLAVRDWTQAFVGIIPFILGAAMYYYVMYRWRVVPRWLAGWGLAGAGLALVATLYSGFNQDMGFTTLNTVLNVPIGVQEMVLAVWLIVKGFNRPALAASAAGAA